MYHQENIRKLKDEAAARLGRGRYRSAVEMLHRLCALQPDEGMHRVRLGHALRQMGRSKEALRAFREAANTFLTTYDYAQAMAATRLVLDIDPTNEGAQQIRREMADRCLVGTAKVSLLAMLAQQRVPENSFPSH